MNEEFMAAIGPNYIADCGKCGVRRLKRNMTAMYIKPGGREGKMKLLCHLCEKCLTRWNIWAWRSQSAEGGYMMEKFVWIGLGALVLLLLVGWR